MKIASGITLLYILLTFAAMVFDGQPDSADSGLGLLTEATTLDIWNVEIGTGNIPIIGGLLKKVIDIGFSLELPYPDFGAIGLLAKHILLWEYEFLRGPLELVRYVLICVSVIIIGIAGAVLLKVIEIVVPG